MKDIKRRHFLKSTVKYSISLLVIPSVASRSSSNNSFGKNPFELKLEVAAQYFDGKSCWVHPRAGIIPNAGSNGNPRVVMTMNTLDLEGSDVFKGMYGMETYDLGKNWQEPSLIENLAPRIEIINGEKRPVAASDFWPSFHRKSDSLLGIGHTVVYTQDWKVKDPRPRDTSYSVYNSESNSWSEWEKLRMPDQVKFHNAGAGCVQRYDEKNGTILLPIYFQPPNSNSLVTVLKCSFDGKQLKYKSHGNELGLKDDTRGLGEPSITKFNDQYFLTIRNDKNGYVTKSKDGQNFEAIRPWLFDDGSSLGNYNTQQHWVTHSHALYLVYTRSGANNDHVFRHRAPLFMAEVDPDRLCVLKETERIIVPEHGARLGNFGVTEISPDETWVTVSEWMQPKGVEKHGSAGRVFIARLLWKETNKLFK